MARTHIAVVSAHDARAILSGAKTAEVRLSRDRRAPFGAVGLGDEVIFRRRGGWYFARARVGRADCLELGSRAGLRRLRERCSGDAGVGPSFWAERSGARYATVVWFEGVEPTLAGPDPRACRSSWSVVDPAAAAWVCEGAGAVSG